MSEVSCAVFPVLAAVCERRGVRFDELVGGLAIEDRRARDPSARCAWTDFAEVLARFLARTSAEECVGLGADIVRKGFSEPYHHVAELVDDVADLYTLTFEWAIPNAYHAPRASVTSLSGGRLEVAVTLDPKLAACEAFLHALTGALIALPGLVGLLDAQVEVASLDARAARWVVAPPSLRDRPRPELAALAKVLVMQQRELRDARAALDRSERYFQTVIEAVEDIVCILDPSGRVRYANPALERTTGFTARDLSQASAIEHVHPDDVAKGLAMFPETMQEGATGHVTLRFRCKDGTFRTFEARGVNRLDDPVVGGILITGRDVTDRVRAEQQLLQAQKMESVGQLAGGVAHDFNNLMAAVLCHTELARDALPQGSAALDDVQQIERAALRAADLTRQLLAFARKQVTNARVVDVAALTEGLARLLRRVLGEDVELTLDLERGLWPVRIDPSQMEQVLLNLALNARDAMPKGGRLRIVARNEPSPMGAHVRVSVIDTGVGMSEATRSRVFEPFFTTKEVGRGTGLGLATCYGIVTQAGGHITVESAPGEGAAFHVVLPRTEEAEPPPATDLRPSRDGSPAEVVLLVEDHDMVRDIAARALRARGYTVLVAVSGAQAIALARDQRVDLLLTDVVMPGMGGPELAARMRAERPALKVVLMSGYAPELAAHANEHLLSKPFTPATLAAAVRAALDA